MDLLRFIVSLPLRFLRALFRLLGKAAKPICGDMAWSAPAWVPATGRAARSHPLKFVGGIAAVLEDHPLYF